jgi:hypothetical protein
MTVRELVESLQKFDPDLDVYCFTEDDSLLAPNHGFRVLEISDVKSVNAEKCRGDDDILSLTMGDSESSSRHVLIDVTADF